MVLATAGVRTSSCLHSELQAQGNRPDAVRPPRRLDRATIAEAASHPDPSGADLAEWL